MLLRGAQATLRRQASLCASALSVAGSRRLSSLAEAPPRLQTQRSFRVVPEATPNLQSLKFNCFREVLAPRFGSGLHITSADTKLIARCAMAARFFDVEGVVGVFLGPDFITISKEKEMTWGMLKPFLLHIIMEQFLDGSTGPVLLDSKEVPVKDTTVLESDDEVVAAIKELMETRIRPSVQEDGGDIFYAGFDAARGLVQVRLAGSCVGCPSSSVTLRNGVEKMLTHYIPEVKGIEEIKDLSDELKLEFKPDPV